MLIIALVLLTVMTLIGVTAMQNTTQEEKMSDNMRQRGLAFQAAESALRAGETYLRGVTTSPISLPAVPPFDSSVAGVLNALVNTGNCDIVTYWLNGHCWNGTTATNCATIPPALAVGACATQSKPLDVILDATLSEQPLYVIEYLYPAPAPGGGDLRVKPINQDSSQQYVYQVTARGTGRTSDAIVILQSLYQR